MDVTRRNFVRALALVESLLPETAFACVDLEFTGLGDTRPSQLDTPATRYATARDDAEPFPPIQFGLALFRRTPSTTATAEPSANSSAEPSPNSSAEPSAGSSAEPSTGSPADDSQANGANTQSGPAPRWQVTPFNFNILPRATYYPHQMRYPYLDRIFNLQASTVEFLMSHGFNFMKLLDDGISWIPPAAEQTLREYISTFLRKKRTPVDNPSRPADNRSKEDRKLQQRWEQLVVDWLSELKKNGSLSGKEPQVTAFKLPRQPKDRRSVFDYIRDAHPRIVTSVITGQDGSQIKLQLCATEDCARQMREEMLREEVEVEVAKSVGFRYVIDALRRAKVPVVLHHGLLDLVKLYGNFVGPLPETIPSFKTAFRDVFPQIYDTRWMVQQMCDQYDSVRKAVDADKVRGIGEVRRVLAEEAKGLGMNMVPPVVRTFVPTGSIDLKGKRIGRASVVESEMGNGFEICEQPNEYDLQRDLYGFTRYMDGGNGRFEHEAGFDAMETGLLFLLLCDMKGLRGRLEGEEHVAVDGFGDMHGARNQIFLGSCGGYRRIDIDRDGEDEVNVYLESGNAFVMTAEPGILESLKETGSLYWRSREVLKQVLAGTGFEVQKPVYISAGPTTMLVLLQKCEVMERSDSKLTVGEKRDRTGDPVNGITGEDIEKVIENGKRVGVRVLRYEEAVGKAGMVPKKRKFI